MMLVEVQQDPLPVTGELISGADGPVVILNLRAELGDHALNAVQSDVPAVSRIFDLLDPLLFVRSGNLGTARIERSPLLGRDLAANLFDQGRKRRLAVGGDGEIDFGVVAVVVNVSA